MKFWAKFTINHIKKLYSLYIPVFILGMLWGLLTDMHNPLKIYNSIGEAVRDFLGVAYIIDGKSPFCGPWWYIGFAITLYCLFPLLFVLVKKNINVLLGVSFLIGIPSVTSISILMSWQRYLFVCCLGIYLAQNSVIDRILNVWKNQKKLLILCILSCVLFCIRCLQIFLFDGILALVLILLLLTLSDFKWFPKNIMTCLGKHSATMFLLHGLLYISYMRDFIYGFWYPPIIFLVLLVITFLVSLVIDETSKKLHGVF